MALTSWLRSSISSSPVRNKQRISCRLSFEYLEARDNPSGGLLDPTFGSGGTAQNYPSSGGALTAVQVLPDGKLLASGYTAYGPSSDFAAARYNADGTPDATFGSGGVATVDFKRGSDTGKAVAVQPGTGGKILVAGTARSNAGDVFGVVRFNPNGTLDTSFGGKGSGGKVTAAPDSRSNNFAQGMAVLPDGRFVVAGVTMNLGLGTVGSISLARFNANGTPDTTFGNKGLVLTTISALGFFNSGEHGLNVALDGSGRIVVAGTTPRNNLTGDFGDFLVARFNANGSLDTTFGGTGVVTTDLKAGGVGSDHAYAMTLQGDGKIVVGGWTSGGEQNSALLAGVARYNPDGSLDSSFDGDGIAAIAWVPPSGQMADSTVRGLAVQPDGKLLLAASGTAPYLMRLNADGSLDRSYGPSGNGVAAVPGSGQNDVEAITLQPDGRAVMARKLGNAAGQATFALSRFTASDVAPSPVQVGSFAAAPNPVAAGSPLTLTAGGITTSNAGATVTKVAFYALDSSGTEQFLGYAAPNSDGTWSLTFTITLAPGSYILLALAVDSYGAISDPLALSLQVTGT